MGRAACRWMDSICLRTVAWNSSRDSPASRNQRCKRASSTSESMPCSSRACVRSSRALPASKCASWRANCSMNSDCAPAMRKSPLVSIFRTAWSLLSFCHSLTRPRKPEPCSLSAPPTPSSTTSTTTVPSTRVTSMLADSAWACLPMLARLSEAT